MICRGAVDPVRHHHLGFGAKTDGKVQCTNVGSVDYHDCPCYRGKSPITRYHQSHSDYVTYLLNVLKQHIGIDIHRILFAFTRASEPVEYFGLISEVTSVLKSVIWVTQTVVGDFFVVSCLTSFYPCEAEVQLDIPSLHRVGTQPLYRRCPHLSGTWNSQSVALNNRYLASF
jgi:hypothetical protein